MYEINNIRLGHVDLDLRAGSPRHHFVVTREEKSLVYNSANIHTAVKNAHRQVPRGKVSTDNILGGGVVFIYQNVPLELQLGANSEFGSLPGPLMSYFKPLLLSEYQKTNSQLEEVVIDFDHSITPDGEFLEFWLERKELKLNL